MAVEIVVLAYFFSVVDQRDDAGRHMAIDKKGISKIYAPRLTRLLGPNVLPNQQGQVISQYFECYGRQWPWRVGKIRTTGQWGIFVRMGECRNAVALSKTGERGSRKLALFVKPTNNGKAQSRCRNGSTWPGARER